MSIQQTQPVVPPTASDRMLRDFAQIIDNNFRILFQAGHVHQIVTHTPTMREGQTGDIYLVDMPGSKMIAVKFNDGWYGTSLTLL